MPLRSALSNVRSRESCASLMVPLIAAPLSTTTLSQPFRPSARTVPCRAPAVALPLNLSVSDPAPPCISVTFVNDPPANASVSAPSRRRILPATAAPSCTVTEESPADPRIA